MRQIRKKSALRTLILWIAFVVFTVLVKVVDVQAVGPQGSQVGFATLNQALLTEYAPFWEKFTEILGYLSLLIVAIFALVGFLQLVRRRALFKVEPAVLLLGCFYILVGLCYVVFEFIELNYRPILQEGELDASYPSSHTVLTICVMGSAIMVLRYLLRRQDLLRLVLDALCVVLIAVAVIGRFLAGIHWPMDILGGILLSAALLSLYRTALLLWAPLRRGRRRR